MSSFQLHEQKQKHPVGFTLRTLIRAPVLLFVRQVLVQASVLIRGSALITTVRKKGGALINAMDFFPTGALIWGVLLLGS